MIQSPRGSINFSAQTSFDNQVIPKHIDTSVNNIQNYTPSHNNNINSANQLVWTNPMHTSLNLQLTRQMSYSETLLHIA